MAKDLTPRQRQIRQQARKLAQNAGKDWAALTAEERRAFLRQARGPGRVGRAKKAGAKKAANPLRARARKAAQDAGLNWQQLSPEQRKTYMRAARKQDV